MSLEGTPADENERLIKIDTEHANTRFIVPVLAFGLVLAIHLVGLPALKNQLGENASVSPTCVMLFIDILIFLAAWYALERIIRRLRPSQRFATLSGSALVVTDARRRPPTVTRIAWDKTVNIKAWKFPITRRTRVPKGWYCMALYLLQDEDEAILYTFMPPQQAETAIGYHNFVQLHPRRNAPSNTDLATMGEQRRLLKLEDLRWQDGAELSPADFNAVLAALQRRVPAWS
jgi:hypothetical protein